MGRFFLFCHQFKVYYWSLYHPNKIFQNIYSGIWIPKKSKKKGLTGAYPGEGFGGLGPPGHWRGTKKKEKEKGKGKGKKKRGKEGKKGKKKEKDKSTWRIGNLLDTPLLKAAVWVDILPAQIEVLSHLVETFNKPRNLSVYMKMDTSLHIQIGKGIKNQTCSMHCLKIINTLVER